MVTYTYDTEIANYSLDEYEDLLDEDEDSLVRVLNLVEAKEAYGGSYTIWTDKVCA